MEHSIHAEIQLPSTKIKEGTLFMVVQKSLPSRQGGATQNIKPLLLPARGTLSTTWKQAKICYQSFHSTSNILSFKVTHPFVQQTLHAGLADYRIQKRIGPLARSSSPGAQNPVNTFMCHDLISTQKTRQWENECPSKVLPFMKDQKAWKRGHFNLCQKWKKWSIWWPSSDTVSWQGLSNPSPFRPHTMPPRENLSCFFFFGYNITASNPLSRALHHPYLGFINKTQEIGKCNKCLMKESEDHKF